MPEYWNELIGLKRKTRRVSLLGSRGLAGILF